ncbi:MAG: BamA/TamA family outer membrane protein, partial [Gammaproteobacteria bacterium]
KSVTLEKGRARDFASLNLPFRAVATDLTDGEMVVLDHGSLAEALRASMSVPGVFAPVEMDGHLLVDGGLVRNLPVQLAREMGADVVIAVDVGTPLEGREALASPLGLSVQTVTVLTRQNVGQSLKQLKAGDILIRPAMGDITALDFSRTDEAVERGEAATWKVADRLTQLALDEKDYQAWLARQRHHGPETLPVIDTIRIRGNRRVSEKLIMSRIRTRPGQRLDMRTLHGDLQAVFSVGDFSHVDFSLEDKQDGHADLVYRVEEKGWGPNYLRFGLNISDDLEGSSHYNLLFSHTLTQVDALGAEWKNELQIGETRRVFSEFFQPLDYRGRFFVAPQLEYQNDSFHLYDQGRPISEYRTRLLQGALDAGWQAGNYGELRIGLERSRLDTELRVGPPDVPTERYDLSGFRLRAIYDQIDNPSFPREGSFVRLDGLYPRPGLGADLSFERLHLSAITAGSYGRNTLMLSVEAGDTAGDALPVAAQFTLGGFLSLSGYKERQLRGQELFAGRLIFYREVHALPPVVGSGIYFGGSLEAGNVWNSRSEVSVSDLRYGSSIFMGMDTVLGALYLGVGLAQNGNQAFYLSLGRSF